MQPLHDARSRHRESSSRTRMHGTHRKNNKKIRYRRNALWWPVKRQIRPVHCAAARRTQPQASLDTTSYPSLDFQPGLFTRTRRKNPRWYPETNIFVVKLWTLYIQWLYCLHIQNNKGEKMQQTCLTSLLSNLFLLFKCPQWLQANIPT